MLGYLLVVSMEYYYGAHTSNIHECVVRHAFREIWMSRGSCAKPGKDRSRSILILILILLVSIPSSESHTRTNKSSTDTIQQQPTKTPVSCIF